MTWTPNFPRAGWLGASLKRKLAGLERKATLVQRGVKRAASPAQLEQLRKKFAKGDDAHAK